MNNNPVKLLFNITDSILDITDNAVKNGVLLTEDKKIETRKETCANCEHLDTNSARCKLCGCYMNIKIRFDGAKCPANKW